MVVISPTSSIDPRALRSLTDEEEIDRIDNYLAGKDRFGYTEILEQVAQEEDEVEGIHLIQQWIDVNHPDLSGLIGGDGAYDFEMRVWIRRVLENNSQFLSPMAREGIIPGAYIESISEIVRNEATAQIPAKKGTPDYIFRRWDENEIDILTELIIDGRIWQDSYDLYLIKRIGKIGRTRQAFRTKWRRVLKQMAG